MMLGRHMGDKVPLIFGTSHSTKPRREDTVESECPTHGTLLPPSVDLFVRTGNIGALVVTYAILGVPGGS